MEFLVTNSSQHKKNLSLRSNNVHLRNIETLMLRKAPTSSLKQENIVYGNGFYNFAFREFECSWFKTYSRLNKDLTELIWVLEFKNSDSSNSIAIFKFSEQGVELNNDPLLQRGVINPSFFFIEDIYMDGSAETRGYVFQFNSLRIKVYLDETVAVTLNTGGYMFGRLISMNEVLMYDL